MMQLVEPLRLMKFERGRSFMFSLLGVAMMLWSLNLDTTVATKETSKSDLHGDKIKRPFQANVHTETTKELTAYKEYAPQRLEQFQGLEPTRETLEKTEALVCASFEDDMKTVINLLRYEPNLDVNSVSSFESQTLKGRNNPILLGKNALMAASLAGNARIVFALLRHPNINVNAQDHNNLTSIMWAAREGHVDIVLMLTSIHNIQLNAQDVLGNSPLIWAVRSSNRTDVVSTLLSRRKIRVNQANGAGNTALHIAVSMQHVDILDILLQHKEIHRDAVNAEGETPLMLASKVGNAQCVYMLLGLEDDANDDSNLSVNILRRDKKGRTAHAHALQNEHKELAFFLAKLAAEQMASSRMSS